MSASKSVQVRESQLRKTPSFLGKIEASVHYGDRLSVLEQKGAWVKVRTDAAQGWLHSSALTTKKIALNPNSSDPSRGASSEELALAGKGFTKQVENKYRQQNKNANFDLVDKMETIIISQELIEEFLKAGNLKPAGGAA